MKFGICMSEQTRERIHATGADYIELSASGVYGMEESYFNDVCAALKSEGIKTYSCNGLVPASVRLTGPEADFAKIKDYAEMCFERLNRIGISMLVFGSSGAKNVPEGFSKDEAWDQLYKVGDIFSDVAKKFGQTIAIEPLRYGEANIVNTIEDGIFYMNQVNRPNFKVLADFYHVHRNNEDISVLEKYKDDIVHIHMASSERSTPDMSDQKFVEDRLLLLKKIGYKGNVSYECSLSGDDEHVKKMIEWHRSLVD